jgi:2-aminoadipate transaminase
MAAKLLQRKEPVSYRFAQRMSRIGASVVREILKVTERPDIISFAGGLPAAELFPVEELARAHQEVFAESGRAAMQYSTTEGWLPLREWVAARMQSRSIEASADRVLITSGSQQGIDLVAKIFLDPGDNVIVENPSYLAALQAFSSYEASIVAVESDEEGMRMDLLEQAIRESNPKFIYVVADFQNPRGTSMSRGRREQMVEVSRRHRVPIVEDNPYGELRFEGDHLPPVASFDRDGLVIHLSTFSKTLSPGMRIGWAVASNEVIYELVIAKQAADLHTSTVEQHAAARLLRDFDYDGHIGKLCRVYGERCRAMLAALEKHFPERARWTRPEGGLFLWVELPDSISGEELLEDALKEKVAFVPGAPFFARDPRRNFIRLNFSNREPDIIEVGIRRIGDVLKRRLG